MKHIHAIVLFEITSQKNDLFVKKWLLDFTDPTKPSAVRYNKKDNDAIKPNVTISCQDDILMSLSDGIT